MYVRVKIHVNAIIYILFLFANDSCFLSKFFTSWIIQYHGNIALILPTAEISILVDAQNCFGSWDRVIHAFVNAFKMHTSWNAVFGPL